MDKKPCSPQDPELRKGPWTMEEDLILINYIANHGEGVWNSLAKAAGLKRTGKSCRLRWLNYLRPDVRRGNITPEEQLLIMELHAKWGNRWSKIAKHLPGRTDNEIKNFWRTRIQKHIKQPETFPAHQFSAADQVCIGHHQAAGTSQVCGGMGTDMIEAYPPSTSTSQMCSMRDMIDDYSPPTIIHPNHNHHLHHAEALEAPPNNLTMESNAEAYWGMEDIWSMQLLNGD
ncbi:hypothetical protein SAY87_023024 [Trapa incisa]|uniref:Uncharacterized protein n=1 Tax=Trapa incisa TaxID=236973 RepID=A0AAN7K8R0_9MYRT|nr:hypothetical protein SAY87_023024 [Trapa incisa]